MPSQLDSSSRQGPTHSSGSLLRKKKRLGTTMSTAWLCLATSTATVAAFTTRNGLAFGKSVLQTKSPPIMGAAKKAFLGAPRNQRTFSLAVSKTAPSSDTSQTTATMAYDLVNKKAGLDKYDPTAFETQIYAWWETAGCFEPDAKQPANTNDKKPYVLPMPPPNVTGRLHMGHAIFVALQDVLARFHRMRGRPVLWLPGKCKYFVMQELTRRRHDNILIVTNQH
jgi:hypothetical protein